MVGLCTSRAQKLYFVPKASQDLAIYCWLDHEVEIKSMELSGLLFSSVLDSVELAGSSPVDSRGGICFSAVPFEAR